jgi:hypothetical protein
MSGRAKIGLAKAKSLIERSRGNFGSSGEEVVLRSRPKGTEVTKVAAGQILSILGLELTCPGRTPTSGQWHRAFGIPHVKVTFSHDRCQNFPSPHFVTSPQIESPIL